MAESITVTQAWDGVDLQLERGSGSNDASSATVHYIVSGTESEAEACTACYAAAPETYAVVDKATGKAVGSIGLKMGEASGIELSEDEAEIGYWIGEAYWGRGLIPEAVREMLRHAFADLGLKKIWCAYYEGNRKSLRVQEKCGFCYAYTKENAPCSMLDELRTEHVSCISREQWEESGK